MPETKAKTIAQSDRLHSLFKFIKFNYILENKDLKLTTKELFKEYSDYLQMNNINITMTKNKMIALLREHDIEYKASNSKAMYNIPNKVLRAIGDKFVWYFDDDVEEADDNLINKDDSNYMKIRKTEYEKMQEQIAELTRQLNEMKTVEAPKPLDKLVGLVGNPYRSKVTKTSKMSLEAVSDKSLFDKIPSKTPARKAKVFKSILDDLE